MPKFLTYFTVSINPDAHEMPQAVLLGAAWHHLHQAAARAKIPFAVAFPDWMNKGFTMGNRIRVFTEDRPKAEGIVEALQRIPGYQDIADETRVYGVREGASRREAFLMRRLPSGVSKNRKTIPLEMAKELQDRARVRRMAEQRGLPFVWMRSSTGNKFKLVVERLGVEGDASGQPNGYGLSRSTQIIGLPVIDG
ncbi:type I-F CRISPR-associated endoribonuclease Cas6/Csy4 [Acidithiobacillus thiooxidans]|uniref:type I-F CRISPR-associated endoribonuclease Cas6/Csy4 n=1 Tax=Acidithiobacillus thiooxidans TaxID=930 RepID=UPI0004E15BA7|nr:type I-F CRISPR-associated endoribonuclease Cas6/Csy4 [Acidithiobacillus thiooxidans]